VMLDDNVFDIPKLVSGKAVVERDLNRLQPDLCLTVVSAHMTAGRLVAVKAHEKEPVGTFPESSRHRGKLEDWLRVINLLRIIRFRIQNTKPTRYEPRAEGR